MLQFDFHLGFVFLLILMYQCCADNGEGCGHNLCTLYLDVTFMLCRQQERPLLIAAAGEMGCELFFSGIPPPLSHVWVVSYSSPTFKQSPDSEMTKTVACEKNKKVGAVCPVREKSVVAGTSR